MVCFILKFARHRRGTMGTKHHTLWQILREGAIRLSEEDALLAPYFHEFILKHASLEEALSAILADKLASTPLTALSLQREIERVFETSAEIRAAVRKDLHAIEERDPDSARETMRAHLQQVLADSTASTKRGSHSRRHPKLNS